MRRVETGGRRRPRRRLQGRTSAHERGPRTPRDRPRTPGTPAPDASGQGGGAPQCRPRCTARPRARRGRWGAVRGCARAAAGAATAQEHQRMPAPRHRRSCDQVPSAVKIPWGLLLVKCGGRGVPGGGICRHRSPRGAPPRCAGVTFGNPRAAQRNRVARWSEECMRTSHSMSDRLAAPEGPGRVRDEGKFVEPGCDAMPRRGVRTAGDRTPDGAPRTQPDGMAGERAALHAATIDAGAGVHGARRWGRPALSPRGPARSDAFVRCATRLTATMGAR
jgi:hypothetical protein